MSEAKFTKGPWSVIDEGHRFEIAALDRDWHICYADSRSDDHRPDANLIAAAPEMYEMLDTAMCRLADEVDDEARSIVRGIIELRKKARGES